MRSYDQIDTDLSNINEELFMKTLVSYRDFERQTVLKYIYEKKSKIPKKIKRDIPEQKMGVPEKSYSSKEAYPYFNNKMDPVYDFPKIILYFINNLPPPWHYPKINIHKCNFNNATKRKLYY